MRGWVGGAGWAGGGVVGGGRLVVLDRRGEGGDEGDDDDDGSDRPDAGDMSLWELMVTRCHNDRRVRMMFAVTRGGARELEKQRSKDQPPRRSQRVAAQREARKIAAKNEPKPDLLRPVRKHWKRPRSIDRCTSFMPKLLDWESQ